MIQCMYVLCVQISGTYSAANVCMCCVYRLVVRILPPVNDKCIVPLGMKFGCYPKQVPHLLKVAKELDLNVVGVRYELYILMLLERGLY